MLLLTRSLQVPKSNSPEPSPACLQIPGEMRWGVTTVSRRVTSPEDAQTMLLLDLSSSMPWEGQTCKGNCISQKMGRGEEGIYTRYCLIRCSCTLVRGDLVFSKSGYQGKMWWSTVHMDIWRTALVDVEVADISTVQPRLYELRLSEHLYYPNASARTMHKC